MATGDVYYRASGGVLTQLGIGASGQVLTVASGLPSWATPSGGGGGGLTNWAEAVDTSAPNATVPVVSLSAVNASAKVDVALVAKGTGSILAQIPTSSAVGGHKRGSYAVDLQSSRSAADQVASGSRSFIAGGTGNLASGQDSIALGNQNKAASYTSITLGTLNNVTGGNSGPGVGAWAVGQQNTISGNGSIGIGYLNTVAGARAASIGYNCSSSGQESFAAGLGCSASAASSIAIGDGSTASASRAIAIRQKNLANSQNSLALRYYSDNRSIIGSMHFVSERFGILVRSCHCVFRNGSIKAFLDQRMKIAVVARSEDDL